jgi:hypothetical protein
MYGYGGVPSDGSHDDKMSHDISPLMYRHGVFLEMGLPIPTDTAGLREREEDGSGFQG